MQNLARIVLAQIAILFGGAMMVAVNANAQPDPNKVLRYAFEVAETTMDPQKVSDVYSSIVNNGMFDPPLRYDYLARPVKLIANTLTAMPDVSPR